MSYNDSVSLIARMEDYYEKEVYCKKIVSPYLPVLVYLYVYGM